MKKPILFALCALFTLPAFAQNRLSLEVGSSIPALSPHLIASDDREHFFRPTGMPAVTAGYLCKIGHRFFIGAKLYPEFYSFHFAIRDYEHFSSGYSEIDHRSGYINLGPQLDMGVGRHQLVHFYAHASIGLKLYGSQTTHLASYSQFDPYDKTYNSSSEISNVTGRIGFGIVEHIRLTKDWHLTLNEGLTFGLSNLTVLDGQGNVKPGYWSLQVGIMKKVHSRAVPEKQ